MGVVVGFSPGNLERVPTRSRESSSAKLLWESHIPSIS
jgi:hypothetical protein